MHVPTVFAFVGTASTAAHLGSASLFHNDWISHEPAAVTTYLNSTILTAPSTAEFTHPGTGFGGPKIHPANGTDFDWWYFDAVSSALLEGDLSRVIIVSYTLSQTAFFGQRQNDCVLAATISKLFEMEHGKVNEVLTPTMPHGRALPIFGLALSLSIRNS
ncbi:hypothetical protein LTR56_027507 [Elasticomyces elasticus]|nr:hypothetical protein LTR56_027507 [Elasticomyces elasticus]KAK4896509.1 hypothetical protein LTR49_028127 [Elasticomyces elasticus]